MFGQGSPDKEVWFEEAKRAYEEFINKRARRGPGLGTFDELEEQAVEAGDRLARFLIENSISAQSTDFDPPEECDCPRCGKPAKRKDEAPDTRELQAKPHRLQASGLLLRSLPEIFFFQRTSNSI